MKNKIALLACMVVVLTLPAMASAQYSVPSYISLILNTQTPYPAEPGSIVNLEVALQNLGSSTSELNLQIVPSEPFSLLSGEDPVKTFSRVSAFDTVTHSYNLVVDKDADSASYEVEFRLYSSDPTSYITKKLSVFVQGTPKIHIGEITTVPEVIEPGHEAEFSVKLENVGTGDMDHLELTLEAEEDSETEESLIVPVLSGGSFYIDSLAPGEEKAAKFKLDIDNEAEYKTYMSTLTINYRNEAGEDATITKTIGIPVKGSPIIEILSAKVDDSDFKVDIENIGTGNAKALKIEFIQDGEVKDSSVASELKPTRHKTLRFSGFRYGEATVKISYLDESNEAFTSENRVDVKMQSSSEDGSGTDTSWLSSILFLLVLAEGYYIWRLRKKLKKK